eukprot:4324819-Amphidinium_carterae.1
MRVQQLGRRRCVAVLSQAQGTWLPPAIESFLAVLSYDRSSDCRHCRSGSIRERKLQWNQKLAVSHHINISSSMSVHNC